MRDSHSFLALALAFAGLLVLPAIAADKALFEGTWSKKGYDIAGHWQIVEEHGKVFVELDQAFRTKNGPDLKIFLSPRPLSELNNRNVLEGALLVGPLSHPKGSQRLAVPAGTDLGRYKTIVIHCEKYSKLWGGAAL